MAFDLTTYQQVCCTAQTPVIRLSRNQKLITPVTLRDQDGDAVDITALPGASGLELSSSSASDTGLELLNVAVTLGLGYVQGSGVILTLSGEILDPTAGELQFSWTPTDTDRQGLFIATIGVLVDDTLVFQMPIYVEIMPTTFRAGESSLTISDVRMDLFDTCPGANYLIDELEFTDAEIIHCMRKTVDVFNEINPPCVTYEYPNFPFRANWLKGTTAYLLRAIAMRYRRNVLHYQAGGVAVADQERATEYEQLASQLEKDYITWATQRKIAVNIGLGYGSSVRSPYGW